MVLQLLLGGARTLGLTVAEHIQSLLGDLRALNEKARQKNSKPGEEETLDSDMLAQSAQPKGLLTDRYSGNAVVVSAPSKIKTSGRELQVPAMSLLTNKNSSQQFLLRILKVIIQLRDAARLAASKAKGSSGMLSNY